MDPYSSLVSAIESRMQRHASQAVAGIGAELGTITGNGLKLDTFKHELPTYMVAAWQMKLKLPSYEVQGTVSGEQGSGVRTFFFDEVEIEGAEMTIKDNLRAGDRVLAIPVANGTEAIVLCKVVNG